MTAREDRQEPLRLGERGAVYFIVFTQLFNARTRRGTLEYLMSLSVLTKAETLQSEKISALFHL